MEKRLEEGFYVTQEMLVSDLQRMLDNCRTYNGEGNVYYEVSQKLELKYLKKWRPVPVI